jgi:hypothetical protein
VSIGRSSVEGSVDRDTLPSMRTDSPLAGSFPLGAAVRSLVVVAAVAVPLASTTACRPESTVEDKTAPRILSVSPQNPIVPVDVALTLTFSEEIDASTIDADPISDTASVALVPRPRADALVTDLKTAGLNDSNEDDVLAIDAVVDGVNVTITPRAALAPLTAYTLVVSAGVRDPASNPIVDALGLAAPFRYDFTTDAGPPAIVTADVGGSTLVAPNRRRISLTFNQPVQGVSGDTLTLSPPAPIEAILVDEARTGATILFGAPADGCARLVPSTEYTLAASSGIVADNGQGLVPFSTTFSTGAACDTTPNQIIGAVEAIAGETSATLRFDTNKPSTTEVRYGEGDVLDCLGAACPVAGASARTAVSGSSPPRFQHTVDLTGLQLGVTYRVVVNAEDDVGQVVRGEATFTTAPIPKIAVNEVMANAAVEPAGEFIELDNFGDVAVDLSGWSLRIDDCTATLPEGQAMAAGSFLVVAGLNFDPVLYALGADVPVTKVVDADGSNGMCGLTNSRAQRVILVDRDGRPVSSFSSTITPSDDGRSVERTAPAAPDVDTSYCRARADAGSTPGRENSVVVNGCE